MAEEPEMNSSHDATEEKGRLIRHDRQPVTKGLGHWLPGIDSLRHYQPSWLLRDLIAGLVLTAVLVPVGMGYAEAAGLQPIYGLYATIAPLVVYAIFGPSRILVLGPDSALAAMIAATIVPLSGGEPTRAATLAAMLAIFSGLFCILAGLARFGFITDLLSKPIRYGYLNGIALTVLVSQMPKLFGFSVHADGLVAEVTGFVRGILSGMTNPVALAIGLGCLAVILGVKRWNRKVPGVLLAVVGATVIVSAFNLAGRAGIVVVGPLPQGLPSFAFPAIAPGDIQPLVAGAIAIALVSFADTSVLARTFALRGGYQTNQNQEMIALGAANVASGFFQGFSISGSASRTPVAEAAGAKTQVTGLIGASCIALLLLFFPELLKNLPATTLGAVVISAALSIIDVPALLRLYRLSRAEFVLSLICFLAVVLRGVIIGIFIAVGVALLNLVWHAWRPYSAVLGRVQNLKGYHDVTRYPQAKRIPGLVLFRWDAPLFFANAEAFRERVLAAVAESPAPPRWVVVAAEPVTDMDVTAADVLAELDNELTTAGIEFSFAEMKDPVKDRLKRYGLFSQVGSHRFFMTLGEAVDRYLAESGEHWTDWEEAADAAEWGSVGSSENGLNKVCVNGIDDADFINHRS